MVVSVSRLSLTTYFDGSTLLERYKMAHMNEQTDKIPIEYRSTVIRNQYKHNVNQG